MEKIYIWIIALMVLSALVTIIKPRIKGKMGEATVSMLLKKLDKNKYQVVNDVLLSAEGGIPRTTQINHVVVSIYGIFYEIEPRIMKGQIYGLRVLGKVDTEHLRSQIFIYESHISELCACKGVKCPTSKSWL